MNSSIRTSTLVLCATWLCTVACSDSSKDEDLSSDAVDSVVVGNGTLRIQNACSGLLLDVAGKSTADGANVIGWTGTGASNQLFKLTAANGSYAVVSASSGKNLDVAGASSADGAAIIQWPSTGGANQRFIFSVLGDGSYEIAPSNAPSKRLTLGSSRTAGSLIELGAANGSCAQKFALLSASGTTPAPTSTGTTPAPTATGTGTTPPSTSSPSGKAAPVGDLPGWHQVLSEEFGGAATAATFDKTYANSWCGYNDGTGGKYYKVISAHDGVMDITLDGTKGAAGSFGPPDRCWGGIYGRYSIRFKADGAQGNGTAIMVWPSSNIWGDGEIDYPEGNFGDQLHVFHHPMNCTDCSSSDGYATGAKFSDWHTATTEWTSASVKYYLDDVLIKTVTHDVPKTDHRYTLQVAPNASQVSAGHMLIDWVALYTVK